jgi:hypothetical protein
LISSFIGREKGVRVEIELVVGEAVVLPWLPVRRKLQLRLDGHQGIYGVFLLILVSEVVGGVRDPGGNARNFAIEIGQRKIF